MSTGVARVLIYVSWTRGGEEGTQHQTSPTHTCPPSPALGRPGGVSVSLLSPHAQSAEEQPPLWTGCSDWLPAVCVLTVLLNGPRNRCPDPVKRFPLSPCGVLLFLPDRAGGCRWPSTVNDGNDSVLDRARGGARGRGERWRPHSVCKPVGRRLAGTTCSDRTPCQEPEAGWGREWGVGQSGGLPQRACGWQG